jgi:hypothetical protein
MGKKIEEIIDKYIAEEGKPDYGHNRALENAMSHLKDYRAQLAYIKKKDPKDLDSEDKEVIADLEREIKQWSKQAEHSRSEISRLEAQRKKRAEQKDKK